MELAKCRGMGTGGDEEEQPPVEGTSGSSQVEEGLVVMSTIPGLLLMNRGCQRIRSRMDWHQVRVTMESWGWAQRGEGMLAEVGLSSQCREKWILVHSMAFNTGEVPLISVHLA